MIRDSLDRIRLDGHTYQPLIVRACPSCGHDTPHEITDVYMRCCVCGRQVL